MNQPLSILGLKTFLQVILFCLFQETATMSLFQKAVIIILATLSLFQKVILTCKHYSSYGKVSWQLEAMEYHKVSTNKPHKRDPFEREKIRGLLPLFQ